jgi:RNA polymerase sigma factor (sigma-70 family)
MSSLSDSFSIYQSRIGAFARPTREEEGAWIRHLRASEHEMVHLLTGIGQVARKLVELGLRVARGEERLDRWLRTRQRSEGACDRDLLESRLFEAKRLLEAQEQFFASQVCTALVEPLRDAILALGFKHRVLEEALDDLQRLERRTHGEMSAEELHQLERDAWMPLVEFRRQVQQAARHHHEAQEAKWRLVDTHLWMVPMIARSYSCRFLTFMDLVQEGNLGLIRAAEVCTDGFDCRFSSYASWWIRQAITRAIEDQERLIRVPSYVSGVAVRLYRVRQSLEQAAGREVEDDEVAWHAGIPLARSRRVLDSYRPTVSIHEAFSPDGEGDELGEFIADEQSATADEIVTRGDSACIVQEVLSTLNEQEREVLSLRFGLHDGDLRTMEEIGRAAGLTRQRIQQIESRAFAKLRHPARLRRFARWL